MVDDVTRSQQHAAYDYAKRSRTLSRRIDNIRGETSIRNCLKTHLKTHKKGDDVIVFQAPEGAMFEPGVQKNEFVNRGTVRVPMSNILYAGPNPW